ncbi:MAG: hypothetical protein HC848_11030 [Limnobacter sp.]|nr:hypothetical protein [Limnobacter sp.]
MHDSFQGGPPLLTEVIESGLEQIDSSTTSRASDPQLEILRAQLPELFERALMRVRPQLMEEFEKVIREALGK